MRAHQADMFQRKAPLLLAAFMAGTFLVGLPQWLPPYDADGLADPAMISALAGLSAIAMMLVVGEVAPPRRAWLTMSLCLPAAAVARAAAQGWLDLWPILLSLVVGAAAVLPGALAGALSLRLQSRGRG